MIKRDPLKSLWGADIAQVSLMTPDQMRKHSGKFRDTIVARNARESIAGLIVIIIFAYFLFAAPSQIAQLGAALTIAGVSFVLWALHNKASAAEPSELAIASSIMAFHRRQLTKQRDALKSVWIWYLLPLLPGPVLYYIGTTPAFVAGGGLLMGIVQSLPYFAYGALIIGAIWLLNRYAAKRLDREIKALDNINN